jgi:hypothetical protein
MDGTETKKLRNTEVVSRVLVKPNKSVLPSTSSAAATALTIRVSFAASRERYRERNSVVPHTPASRK